MTYTDIVSAVCSQCKWTTGPINSPGPEPFIAGPCPTCGHRTTVVIGEEA